MQRPMQRPAGRPLPARLPPSPPRRLFAATKHALFAVLSAVSFRCCSPRNAPVLADGGTATNDDGGESTGRYVCLAGGLPCCAICLDSEAAAATRTSLGVSVAEPLLAHQVTTVVGPADWCLAGACRRMGLRPAPVLCLVVTSYVAMAFFTRWAGALDCTHDVANSLGSPPHPLLS